MTVVLTYSFGRLRGLAEALYDVGFDVEHTPLIETRAIETDTVKAQAQDLAKSEWLLFTSQAAVEAWRSLGLGFENAHIGTVGKKTAEKIEDFNAKVAVIAEPQNAQGLVNCFTAHPEACGVVGLPQGGRALPALEEKLNAMGFETKSLKIYETVALEWRVEKANIVVLASPSVVEQVPDLVGKQATLITLGETTQEAVKARGWKATQAESPSVDAVFKLIERLVPA